MKLKGAKCLNEIFVSDRIFDLGPVNLVIVSRLDNTSNVIKLKVYEREHYFRNLSPTDNLTHIAQYSICPSCFTQAVHEIQELYAGWSKIDKTQSLQIIGIHNQDPKILLIQFSHGERYFIYQRCPKANIEMVREELFGKKHHLRQRSLCYDDEQYLISLLRFMPKTKKAISFYPHKPSSRLTRARKHLSLTHSS